MLKIVKKRNALFVSIEYLNKKFSVNQSMNFYVTLLWDFNVNVACSIFIWNYLLNILL